jgi:hypothetical protein
MYQRLERLRAREYIGRTYDKSYHLQHRPANYYLLPKAIGLLKKQEQLNPRSLKAMYRDRLASDQFKHHCLQVFRIYNELRDKYAGLLTFFSKSELADYDYFPIPLPDGYFIVTTKEGADEYLLEAVEATTPFFVIRRRIERYSTHFQSGEWEAASQTPYPQLLLVCDDDALQQRLQRYLGRSSVIEEIGYQVVRR